MGKNEIYKKKAHEFIPGGSHTYSRSDDSYPITFPSILEKGEGCYVWDVEGNKYLDYGMALRAVTIGYNEKSISDAAYAQILNGNNLTRASMIEVEAAERLCNLIPHVDMVKFAKNGSTVTTAAIKLARAYTGRDYIARCKQHPFFSYDDWFIGDTIMDSGIPNEHKGLTLNFDFNNIESVTRLFDSYRNQIAALILEPATTDEPKDGFLTKLREMCNVNGTLLIMDEMITGFRWHIHGASAYYNVEPDLVTYGKGMANGFSVAALGGKREIMELGGIDHDKERVFLISTTHGAEMCGMGAFVETLNFYQSHDVIEHMWDVGRTIMQESEKLAIKHNVSEYFGFYGVPCSPNYYTKNVDKENDLAFRTLFVQEMAKSGVLMPWVAISYVHGEKEIEITLNAIDKALSIYYKALNEGISKYLIGRPIKPVFRKYN